MPAMSLVWDILPAPSKEDYKTSLLWAQDFLNKAGITTAHDAWMEFDTNYYNAYNELANAGLLTVRYRGAWYINPNAETGYITEINNAKNLLQKFTHPLKDGVSQNYKIKQFPFRH